jgi:hypothetical protein
MNLNWLFLMTRWVRHPPSPRQVRFLLVVVALSCVLVGVEHFLGWPDWLRVNGSRMRLPKP